MIGRTERILLYLTGGLLAAVLVAVTSAPRIPATRARVTTREPRPSRSDAPSLDETPSRSQSNEPRERFDTLALRARLISGAPGTYLLAMAEDEGWWLHRWPDRTMNGLRVWVEPSSDVPGWTHAYAQVARDAFDDWGSSGSPLRFVFPVDSAGVDVRVLWIDHFPPAEGRRIGVTDRRDDEQGWVTAATIRVALHDSTGYTFTPAEVAGIIRHEVGHALGLGHTPDRDAVMFAFAGVTDIAPIDRATLRLLYTLPPGRLIGIAPGAESR